MSDISAAIDEREPFLIGLNTGELIATKALEEQNVVLPSNK